MSSDFVLHNDFKINFPEDYLLNYHVSLYHDGELYLHEIDFLSLEVINILDPEGKWDYVFKETIYGEIYETRYFRRVELGFNPSSIDIMLEKRVDVPKE